MRLGNDMAALASVIIVGVLLGPVAARGDDAASWIERSHEAVFESEQSVVCQTPAGQVDGVFSVRGTGEAVIAGRGGETPVYGVAGMFASTGEGFTGIRVPMDETGSDRMEYVSVEVDGERFEGRRTRTFEMVRDGVVRTTMAFDVASGALISMITLNADGSDYCVVRTGSFAQPVGLSAVEAMPVEVVAELEAVDVDPVTAPTSLAGFVRLDTYRWRDTGTATFYSDGLFSFTLIATPSPFALDESDAEDVVLDGGEYRRLFEPGRVTYVWESEIGGMAIIGDMPLDLQEAILADLAPSERPNMLTRLWRRLFR